MKVSYARYKQMMLEEKRRQSAQDACKTQCANIKEILRTFSDKKMLKTVRSKG